MEKLQKVKVDEFIGSLIKYFNSSHGINPEESGSFLDKALADQGLKCVDGKIVTDISFAKFKEGDWLIGPDDEMFKVIGITGNQYILSDICGDEYRNAKTLVEKHSELWTIEKAKKGDFIYIKSCTTEWIMIFKELIGSDIFDLVALALNTKLLYVGDDIEGFWGKLNDVVEIRPALDVEIDMILNRLEKDGYEWNSEKRTVDKKIETTEIPINDTTKVVIQVIKSE